MAKYSSTDSLIALAQLDAMPRLVQPRMTWPQNDRVLGVVTGTQEVAARQRVRVRVPLAPTMGLTDYKTAYEDLLARVVTGRELVVCQNCSGTQYTDEPGQWERCRGSVQPLPGACRPRTM